MDFKIIIPGKPIAKRRPRFFNRRAYDTQGQYKKQYQNITLKQIPSDYKIIDQPIHVDFEFHMSIPQSWSKKKQQQSIGMYHISKPDIDNLIKFMDVWNGILWVDDQLICSFSAVKIYDKIPKTILHVTKLQAPGKASRI